MDVPGWVMAGAAACVVVWAVVLSAYDIMRRRLPNIGTYTGAIVALVVSVSTGNPRWLLGGLVWAGLYALIRALSRLRRRVRRSARSARRAAAYSAAFGAGDIKLGFSTGTLAAAVSPEAVLVAIVVAQLLTVLVGVVTRRATVAHGPMMLLAALGVAAYGLGWGAPIDALAPGFVRQ